MKVLVRNFLKTLIRVGDEVILEGMVNGSFWTADVIIKRVQRDLIHVVPIRETRNSGDGRAVSIEEGARTMYNFSIPFRPQDILTLSPIRTVEMGEAHNIYVGADSEEY